MRGRQQRGLRQIALQVLAALAVGASGVASLGTTDCTTEFAVQAQRDVEFGSGETERLVSVRFSSADFVSLVVSTEPGFTVAQVDPPPVVDDTGGVGEVAGTNGSSGAAGASARTSSEPPAPAPSPAQSWRVDSRDYYHQPPGISRYIFQVARDDGSGSQTVPVLAVLTGESCYGPPALDLRVDVID